MSVKKLHLDARMGWSAQFSPGLQLAHLEAERKTDTNATWWRHRKILKRINRLKAIHDLFLQKSPEPSSKCWHGRLTTTFRFFLIASLRFELYASASIHCSFSSMGMMMRGMAMEDMGPTETVILPFCFLLALLQIPSDVLNLIWTVCKKKKKYSEVHCCTV